MDDLRERLKQLRPPARPGHASAKGKGRDRSEASDKKVSTLRKQLERMERIADGSAVKKRQGDIEKPRRLEEVLNGSEVETPLGTCYEIQASYRAMFRHGNYCLGDFSLIDLNNMDIFCSGVSNNNIKPEDVLFVDIETTGLSLGTGTYAFLLGYGYYRQEKFHIHQLFLRNFVEEPAFLHYASSLMAPFRLLVTFNGKRFDLPILASRFTMCGMSMPFSRENRDLKIDWDLLYPARRLWQDRLNDCRLGTIEGKRLGVCREETDIPGDQIPEVYYRYIHQGDSSDLEKIVYHNAMDVLSLATLVIHMDRSLKEKDPKDVNLLSVGRYYEKKGIEQLGRKCYEITSGKGFSPQEKDRALFLLAMQMKREGNIENAVDLWKTLVQGNACNAMDGCIELAKYYEHRTKEMEKAIETVEYALALEGYDVNRYRDPLMKRLERLKRKKGKMWGK